MSEWQVGDKVRVVSKQDGWGGGTGTITQLRNSNYPIRVTLDNGYIYWYNTDALEKEQPMTHHNWSTGDVVVVGGAPSGEGTIFRYDGVDSSGEHIWWVNMPGHQHPIRYPEYAIKDQDMTTAISKQHYPLTDADPLGQQPRIQHCAVCNKEYSGNQVAATVKRSIIGGMSYISPIGPINNVEQVNLGPCCARKVDEFILGLKTNRAPETTRKNATKSWMPHDEEGNL